MRGSSDGTLLRGLVYVAILGGIALWTFFAATVADWIDKLGGG
ncbi:hypothetical protein [Kitasatospora griseola]